MIAVVDYGVGNLFSLTASLKMVGADSEVTSDPERILAADKIILPGVGAFGDAAARLSALHLDDVLRTSASRGTPLMGICLGMQLLLDKSYEYGEHEGLGLIKGNVRPIADVIDKDLKIPHIGWNRLIVKKPSPLFQYLNDGDCVYFVHSYYAADCGDSVTAVAEYSAELTASVEKGNVFGCQFHPEKSGDVGLKILKAFCEI